MRALLLKRRPARHKKKRTSLLCGYKPMRRGVVRRVLLEVTPKKPHSAKRKAVAFEIIYRSKLKNRAYLKGVGAGELLKKHDTIFFNGGRRRDVPAMKYTAMYGVETINKKRGSLERLPNRKNARSKYGIKLPDALRSPRKKREVDVTL